MSWLKDIAKNAALMFAVGALLAVASPYIAGMLGEAALGTAAFTAAKSTSVLWTAAFFSSFGAIHAVLAPSFNAWFGEQRAEESAPKANKRVVLIMPSARVTKTVMPMQDLAHAPAQEVSDYAQYVRERPPMCGGRGK